MYTYVYTYVYTYTHIYTPTRTHRRSHRERGLRAHLWGCNVVPLSSILTGHFCKRPFSYRQKSPILIKPYFGRGLLQTRPILVGFSQ